MEIFDGRCAICGAFLGGPANTPLIDTIHLIASRAAATIDMAQINLDHVQPASLGGPDHFLNYAPTHESCNKARGSRPASEAELDRVRQVQRDYESNGHEQLISRMIVAGRDIDVSPELWFGPLDGSEPSRALSLELGSDCISIRLEVRRCGQHGYHVIPEDPEYCVEASDPAHACTFDSCTWPFQGIFCHMTGAMTGVHEYPFTLFCEVPSPGHVLEIARFLEAFAEP